MTKAMRLSCPFWAPAMVLITAQPSQAAETIDFENTGCKTGSTSFCEIPDTYGDTQRIDVSYASINILTGARSEGLYRYGVGYGDLNGVIFGGRNRTEYASEIRLEAKNGFELSLLDFDFASFANRSPMTPIVISDLAGNIISEGVRSTGGSNHSNYTVNSPFGDGVVIRWGPDGYEVGLDNIRYEAGEITGAVPEPGTWAMMILGFGAVGLSARVAQRKKRLTFAAA